MTDEEDSVAELEDDDEEEQPRTSQMQNSNFRASVTNDEYFTDESGSQYSRTDGSYTGSYISESRGSYITESRGSFATDS